jgi:hypothetical protein
MANVGGAASPAEKGEPTPAETSTAAPDGEGPPKVEATASGLEQVG